MNPPKIFISATSGDLSSARQIAKEALLTINCHPVEQTNFEPDWRSVTDMLRGKISDCQALIHLVGFRYGAEPDPATLPGGTPRRSYTQMEYHLARELGLRVYTFLLPETYPFDVPAKAETPEQTQLQTAHRALIQSSPHLYEKPANDLDLRTRIIALQEKVIGLEQEQQSIVKEVTNLATTLTTGQKQLAAQLSVVTAKIEQQAKKIKLPRLAQCRKDMLAKVRYDWIEGVLLPSVNESNRFNIGQKLVPSAVVTDHRFPDREFGPEDDIVKLFDDSDSRLLILGNPGGGKTMLLLRLAERLLERAEKDPKAPIPVVLNLSSWWRDRLPLDQWMIREGSTAYQIPIAVMTRWVRDEAITPLLDGLDEVGLGAAAREAWVERTNRDSNAPTQGQDEGIEGAAAKEARAACLEAINRYCQPNKNDPDSRTSVGIAVCSRSSEYGELTDKLRLNGALMLQDLSDCQVHSVISQDHMKGVRDLSDHEPWIASMSRNPFLLNVMSAAYANKSLAEKPSQTERQRHLMGEYVNLRLKESHDRRQNKKALDATQIRHLLTWLAKNMTESGQTVFHVESLQMTWLSRLWARCAYCIGSRLVFGASGGLASGMFTLILLYGYVVITGGAGASETKWVLLLVFAMALLSLLGIHFFASPGVVAAALEWRRSTTQLPRLRRLASALWFCAPTSLLLGPWQNLIFAYGMVAVKPQDYELGQLLIVTLPRAIGHGLAQAAFCFVAIWLCRRVKIERLAIIYGASAFLLPFSVGVFYALFPEHKDTSPFHDRIVVLLVSAFLGLGLAIFAALASLVGNQIQSAERIHWKWSSMGALVIGGFLLIPAALLLVAFHFTDFYTATPIIMAKVLLVSGVGFIFGGIAFGLKRGEMIQRRVTPNEGVVRSIKSSLFIAGGFGAAGSLVAVVVITIISGVSPRDWVPLVPTTFQYGAPTVLLVTLMFTLGAFAGGLDVPVKHWVLRVLLTLAERIPFRLSTRLEDISEVLLLRKVGGGFVFTHRFLREYFA